MPIDFFDQEVARCQERFGEIYRQIDVCNTKTQTRIFLSILSMGLAARKIQAAESRDVVRDDIKKFVRTRDVLTYIFDDEQKKIITKQRRKS